MQFQRFLAEEKVEILPRWLDLVYATYPADAVPIFKREKDRFANPIGFNTEDALNRLYDLLFSGETPDYAGINPVLEHFVKIRAVQTFTPSEAVAFVFFLKKAVRNRCAKKDAPALTLTEWQEFEEVIDRLAGMVFDLYMACRERLYQVRVHEITSMNHMVTRNGCPSAFLDADQSKAAAVNPIHIQSNNEAR